MSTARFKVTGGRFDGATSATVEIDREKGLVHVRPHRRREAATVTLAWVAETVLWQAAKASAVAKRGR